MQENKIRKNFVRNCKRAARSSAGTQSTCFTSAKVQILTLQALQALPAQWYQY
jgi:hypothetical protein